MSNKSETSHAVLDEISRQQKAQKIIKVLEAEIDLSKASVLDIGTGSGYIANTLSLYCKEVASVDLHDERVKKEGYTFKKVQDETLPFQDKIFDVVITNHVIEHVPNHELHLSEINRVLKSNGAVYLATPNKFWFTDPHHKLPFISWLPRRVANKYLQLLKGREWDIFPLSYREIINLTNKEFVSKYVTLDVIKKPDEYKFKKKSKLLSVASRTPKPILNTLKGVAPTHIFVFKKR